MDTYQVSFSWAGGSLTITMQGNGPSDIEHAIHALYKNANISSIVRISGY